MKKPWRIESSQYGWIVKEEDRVVATVERERDAENIVVAHNVEGQVEASTGDGNHFTYVIDTPGGWYQQAECGGCGWQGERTTVHLTALEDAEAHITNPEPVAVE